MKTLKIIIVLIFLFNTLKSQDTIRRFEFGSTLVTINSFNSSNYFAPDRPSIEYINGLFFRYTKKRLGIRVLVSYTDNYYSYSPPPNWADAMSGSGNNKDFRLGIGAQFSILKKREWFYTFADISYRNVFSTGYYSGGIAGYNNSFSATSNGFDTFFGLGFKIKTLKNIYLSPELGYNISFNSVNYSTTHLTFGEPSNYNYTQINAKPIIKLHLTVKF